MREGCGHEGWLLLNGKWKNKSGETCRTHHESTFRPTSTDEDAAASSPRGIHTTDSRPSMTFLVGFRYTTTIVDPVHTHLQSPIYAKRYP
jgi:hypothetical protein